MSDPEVHSASRVIIAPPRAIFRAMVDPETVAIWRAPEGMTAEICAFDARTGGAYRMVLHYPDRQIATGKSGGGRDVVRGRFVTLDPYALVVEAVEFETGDPAFAGTMMITTRLTPVSGGTKVTIEAADVPSGIRAEDHRLGIESSLKKLALLVE